MIIQRNDFFQINLEIKHCRFPNHKITLEMLSPIFGSVSEIQESRHSFYINGSRIQDSSKKALSISLFRVNQEILQKNNKHFPGKYNRTKR